MAPVDLNGTASTPPPPLPDPEVRARRRRFTAADKLRIVEEADRCTQPGQLGALLRREGLYSSQLAQWRRDYRRQGAAGLAPKPRGRPPTPPDLVELARLRAENAQLTKKLAAAELVITVQKNVAALLGVALTSSDESPTP
jgi:transposase-like protein